MKKPSKITKPKGGGIPPKAGSKNKLPPWFATLALKPNRNKQTSGPDSPTNIPRK